MKEKNAHRNEWREMKMRKCQNNNSIFHVKSAEEKCLLILIVTICYHPYSVYKHNIYVYMEYIAEDGDNE